MRAGEQAGRRVFRLWLALRQASRARGGLVPLALEIWTVLRREGPRGLRRLATRAASVDDYGRWVREHDTPDAARRTALLARLADWREAPLISILVPVFDPAEPALREMIESVLAQWYPHWELCLCNDASRAAHVVPTLAAYAARDARIKVVHRERNAHISAASNAALAVASGRFLALLDHDDVLPPHALATVAAAVRSRPQARLLYSDEDKLAQDGTRIEPYFKPNWDPLLALGQNLFSHLGVFDSALVREVGGFRTGFEGSQDLDLVLRCAERIEREQIVHIPQVLYHWRLSAQSTARDVGAKPYVVQAALRAVREHLARRGIAAHVEPLRAGASMLKVMFCLPTPVPQVSVVIPSYAPGSALRRCIERLLHGDAGVPLQIVVVDAGSDDAGFASLGAWTQDARIECLRADRACSTGALFNLGVQHARGSLVCLLDEQIEAEQPGWLATLCAYALQSGIGAAGAMIWDADERLVSGELVLGGATRVHRAQHGLSRHAPGYFARAWLAHECAAVSAACLVVARSAYLDVGGMRERIDAPDMRDADLGMRLRASGHRSVVVPYAAVRLASGAVVSGALPGQESSLPAHDPYYNPNLALDDGDTFRLAFPPRACDPL